MKTYTVVLGAFLCLILNLIGCSKAAKYDLALKNVSLFDSKGKTVLENKTVLINADTIAAIVDASEKFTAKEIIAGKERLLTPGFIDTHTHLMENYSSGNHSSPEQLPQEDFDLIQGLMAHHYLAHGVTTIIDMGQPETWMDVTLNWQKNPSPNYPNLFICGGSIVSDEDRWQPPHHIEVMNPEDGRKKVRAYAEKGLKHMKLYRKLRKPDMEAMVEEAKKYDITINTHTDNNVVTIDEAMAMGIRNFEHFFTVTPSIMNYDIHWKAMNEKYGIQMNSSIDEFAAHMVFFFSYIKENPEYEAKLEGLFDRMGAKGATLSTAINVLASAAGKTEFFTSFDYFPIRKTPMVSYSEEQQRQLENAFEAMMMYVKKAHKKGVKLRVGTDCRFGGISMLTELQLLFRAGIPMTDVLQIATLNGYESMKLDKEYGSIEIGKKADLLLFDKNPFDNYKNLMSEKTIIKGGKVFSLKKSLAYELQSVMIDNGAEAGLTWLTNLRNKGEYAPFRSDELKNVFKELLGTGKIDEAKAIFDLYSETFPDAKMDIEGGSVTNAVYALLRNKEIEKAISFYDFGRVNFPDADKTLPQEILITTLRDGIEEGKERYAALKDNEDYIFNEDEMNGVGYLVLQLDKLTEALALFKLNVEAFPNSWNVHDSLGEAYALSGQKELAIRSYERSIVLNPDNENGKRQLKMLRSKR